MTTQLDNAKLKQLQLFARGVVDGLTGGRHRSKHRGSSVEFKEHRGYARGDSPRTIDWKLYGKTDRLFIRQFEDETSLRSILLVDQSGSMGYAGSRSQGLTKHDYAIQLAASIATLLLQQQDAVGLATINKSLQQFLPPRSNGAHLRTMISTLSESTPQGETSLGDALLEAAQQLRHRGVSRGIVFILSDFFDDIQSLRPALQHFLKQGHEVIAFTIWDHDESNFPFQGRTQFRSLESGRERILDSNAFRSRYLAKVREFRQQLADEFASLRVGSIFCSTDEDCTEVLRAWLHQRQRSVQRAGVKP
ncbi:MAG: DUF58 domain-containing protein [Planctomycetota bacterium]